MDNRQCSNIIGGGKASNRKASDLYPTPAEVTIALLDFLKLPEGTTIWEPACGDGRMVDVMRRLGYVVTATDIQSGTDFLTAPEMDCEWVITNPPFCVADKFIERCIEIGKPFALLLKSQYWHAKKRLDLFRSCPPSFICPLTWRPDFAFGQRGNGRPLMDVMWVIWDMRRFPQYIPLERPKQKELEDTNETKI